MNIEKRRAFLESLDGDKGLPDKMHGIRFSSPLDFFTHLIKYPNDFTERQLREYLEYFQERIRRAESHQTPDLKEKVKELALNAMNSQRIASVCGNGWAKQEVKEFRALCKPEKDSKEAAR